MARLWERWYEPAYPCPDPYHVDRFSGLFSTTGEETHGEVKMSKLHVQYNQLAYYGDLFSKSFRTKGATVFLRYDLVLSTSKAPNVQGLYSRSP
jgi:hypothetical protein